MTVVHDRITAAAYHADYSRISNSMLSVFRQSRQRYFRRFVEQSTPAPQPTAAMQLGSLVHSLVLEPESVGDYVVAPHCDRRTKDGKATWAAFMESSGDKTVIDGDDLAEARRIADAVMSNSVARRLLSGNGENETSHFWKDKVTGIECKCRPDRLCDDLLIDLKTTHDATPKGFAESCARLSYHSQAAFYQDGIAAVRGGETLPFVFIAVCTVAPYDVACFEIDSSAIDIGRERNNVALRELAGCIKSGEWREIWQRQITTLTLPKWTAYADEYTYYE